MEDARQMLNHFFNKLNFQHNNYGREWLQIALRPALEFEASIRHSMADLHLDPYVGLFDPFSLPRHLRCVYAREDNADLASDPSCYCFFSRPVGYLGSFPKHTMFPLHRSLRRETDSPCMVENIDIFRKNFEIFTHGALSAIVNWDNMIVTGGSVAASLLSTNPDGGDQRNFGINRHFQSPLYRSSDVDIFFYGLTPEQALRKLEEVCDAIDEVNLWKTTYVRKPDVISIHSLYPRRPIQIRLHMSTSPAEVLANCDIDSACCAYNGSTVYLNPRSLIAFMCQSNTIDLCWWSQSYEIRLAQYAARGFEISVPELDRSQVDYPLVYHPQIKELPMGLVRLLVLELLNYCPDHLARLESCAMKKVGPADLPSSGEFAPIDKRLTNGYEMIWAHIPYSPKWDGDKLDTLFDEIDKVMNPGVNAINGRRLHRHPLHTSDKFSDCIAEVFYDCPAPTTAAEIELIRSEAGLYCRGPLIFHPRFPPRDADFLGVGEMERLSSWTKAAYRVYDPLYPTRDKGFFEVSRKFWLRNTIFSRTVSERGYRYTLPDGVVPILTSSFRVHLEEEDEEAFEYYASVDA